MKKSGSCTRLIHELVTMLFIHDVIRVNSCEVGELVSEGVCTEFRKWTPYVGSHSYWLQCLEGDPSPEEIECDLHDVGPPVAPETHHSCGSVGDHKFPDKQIW
jgi:hypothetical protein